MRSSVLTGSLALVVLLLVFLPAVGLESPPRPPREPAPPPRPSLGAAERPPWLRELAPLATEGRWASLLGRLDAGAGAPAESPRRSLLEGLAARRTGDAARARRSLERAVSTGGHELRDLALVELAGLRSEAGHRGAAIELRREALRHAPASRQATIRLGLARDLVGEHRPDEALETLVPAIEWAGSDAVRAEALALAAELAEALGRLADAEAWRGELFWRHPVHPAAVEVADRLTWKDAVAVAAREGRHELVLERAEALIDAGRAKTLIGEMRELLRHAPPGPTRDRALLQLGRGYRMRRDPARAATHLEQVGTDDPETWARATYNHALAARALRRRGDYLRLLRRLVDAPPSEWRDRALERLASVHESAGRTRSARQTWQRLAEGAERPSRAAEAAWKIAWSFDLEGDDDAAVAAYERLIADHPGQRESAAAAYWSARILRDRGRAAEAEERLEWTIAHFPNDYHALLAAEELGRPAPLPPRAEPHEPERCLSRLALALETETPGQGVRLGELFRLGLVEHALEELGWLESDGEPRGEAWSEAAWQSRVVLLGQLGQHREALFALREAAPEWRTRDDVPAAAWHAAYPLAFDDLVLAHAAENRLDPALVFGLIHQESVFQADAVSHAGARGLMQIMPGTGRTIARWFGERTSTDDLHDPALNVRYGTAYLRRLLDNLDHPELALAGYNAGGTRARRWWSRSGGDLALFVESIPFDETRNYVKAVTWNRHYYRNAGAPAGAAGAPGPSAGGG